MGESLKKANKSFEMFISKLKKKPTEKALLYLAFLSGFMEGSGIKEKN